MPSVDRPHQSGRNYRSSQLMINCLILALGLYPIIRRKIDSDHRMRFGRRQDGNVDKSVDLEADTSKCRKKRIQSNFTNDFDQYEKVINKLKLVKNWYKIHYIFCMSIYALELFRYLLINVISLEALSEYHYLDCYLLGRFRFIGRTNKISASIVLILCVAMTIYRYAILKPYFKYSAMEFMLHDFEYVVENEKNFAYSQQVAKRPVKPLRKPIGSARKRLFESCTESEAEKIQPNRIFYLENLFYEHSIQPEWILRPNRTSKSWIVLNEFSRFALYSIIVIMTIFLLMVLYLIAGSIVTNLGFEMSYPTCVAYIQKKQRNSDSIAPTSGAIVETLGGRNETAYSCIYLAPDKLAHQKNIEDIPAIIAEGHIDWRSMNTYSMIRIGVDVLENIFWWSDLPITIMAVYYIMLISSIDVMLNANEVIIRLKEFNNKLTVLQRCPSPMDSCVAEQQRIHNPTWSSIKMVDHINYPIGAGRLFANRCHLLDQNINLPKFLVNEAMLSSRIKWFAEVEKLDTESIVLQAILVDHFLLIREYSKVVAFHFNFILWTFFLYTLIIIYWTITIKSHAVEFEFIAIASMGSILAILFFSSAALARSTNYRLYKLITQAMARDTDPASRERWASITNYYKPRPLYCFLLFNSIEISWLLCLKFVSWMLSAFVVLASFFYMNPKSLPSHRSTANVAL